MLAAATVFHHFSWREVISPPRKLSPERQGGPFLLPSPPFVPDAAGTRERRSDIRSRHKFKANGGGKHFHPSKNWKLSYADSKNGNKASRASLHVTANVFGRKWGGDVFDFFHAKREESRRKVPPNYHVSLNPDDVDVEELSDLLLSTGQNCSMAVPDLDPNGNLAKPDPVKLRRAIKHSTVVVGFYIWGDEIPSDEDSVPEQFFSDASPNANRGSMNLLPNDKAPPFFFLGNRIDPSLRAASPKRRLVAFGRATSDSCLTASIHDLAVTPSLQGFGLGKTLVARIVKELLRKGIVDIAVLSKPSVRPFFDKCNFGYDRLNSTTMVYSQCVEDENTNGDDNAFLEHDIGYENDDDNVRIESPESDDRGRRLKKKRKLLIPPFIQTPFPLKRPLPNIS